LPTIQELKRIRVAGVTVVFARRELIERESSKTPIILRYKTHLDKNSLYNTPPVFAIYTFKSNIKLDKEYWGIDEVHRRNHQKANLYMIR